MLVAPKVSEGVFCMPELKLAPRPACFGDLLAINDVRGLRVGLLGIGVCRGQPETGHHPLA